MKNLMAEMARTGVTTNDIRSLLGCSSKTIRNKLNEKSEFTFGQAYMIRDAFFPTYDIRYLFALDKDTQKERG